MAAVLNIIFIFAIISNILQTSTGIEKAQWKIHKLISKDGWTGKVTEFDNPTFVYALCKDEYLNNSKLLSHSKECMIVLHKDVHNDEKPIQCTFTLENASNDIMGIESFGTDRAIFVWADETKKNKTLQWTFNTAMIQFSNCKIVNTGLQLNTKTSAYGERIWYALHVSILSYEETFEVIIQGLQACGDAVDDSHCVYTYNNDGKLIGGPVTIFSPHVDKLSYNIRPLSLSSPNKGYLVNVVQKVLQVSIMKPTGKFNDEVMTKLLWKFSMDDKGHDRSCYATNNEMIGMCSCQILSVKLSCVCLQFNQEGNSKRKMEISVRKSSEATTAIIFLHNLREGGLFFMPFYTDNEKHFYSMTKVNADGKVIGEPIVIGSHSRTCTPDFTNTRWIEMDDGQYCITLACNEKSEQVLKTLTKCYTSSSLDWKFHAKDHIEL